MSELKPYEESEYSDEFKDHWADKPWILGGTDKDQAFYWFQQGQNTRAPAPDNGELIYKLLKAYWLLGKMARNYLKNGRIPPTLFESASHHCPEIDHESWEGNEFTSAREYADAALQQDNNRVSISRETLTASIEAIKTRILTTQGVSGMEYLDDALNELQALSQGESK